MASQPVHPLRIQKGTPSSSPIKTASSLPRALTELAPTEKRRNSPSFNQTSKKMTLNGDSSPFQSSPFNASESNSSPRLFWQGRDPAKPNRVNSENVMYGHNDSTLSPTRRSSIEKLQKASRVKNSNMFAREQKHEYDPAAVPVIERPLAKPIQGNAFGGMGLQGLKQEERARPFSHKRTESKSSIPFYSPTKALQESNGNDISSPRSRSKHQTSPSKSSLSSRSFNPKASFDLENVSWSEEISGDERELPEGRSLHRHAKSVTFDAAPPQVNEYEMATPDLSSVGTGSRENSYDSTEDEDSYNQGNFEEREDSFDASLEDTDKTPVVGPDDWRHASPSTQHGIMGEPFEDPFQGPEGSPMPGAGPASPMAARPTASRNDSLNSNGDHRPLPPLPDMDVSSLQRPRSSHGLSVAAERASSFQRSLPSPPQAAPISKSDIQGMTGSKMTLEERLRLMMIQDDEKPKTTAELQRERRMRRAGARERSSQTPERDNGQIDIYEDEDTLGELGEYQLPLRISRESILRKVNGQDTFGRESDYNFSSPVPSSSPERAVALDPDVPIPSTEDESILDDDQSVIIKTEPMEDEIDLSSITEMYHRTESRLENYDDNSATFQDMDNDEDAESEYSDPTPVNPSPQGNINNITENEGPPTPQAPSPAQTASIINSFLEEKQQVSLPEFSSFISNSDFRLSLLSYMTPSPPPVPAKDVPAKDAPEREAPQVLEPQEDLQRPSTPEANSRCLSRPEYDGSGWGPEEDEYEAETPDSVIHHPMPLEPSPSIPEQAATIKSASGSKLKTRPSATPSDLVAMREARRQISGEMSNVPPIPERHRNRPSLNLDQNDQSSQCEEGGLERDSSFKKKSLTLDIGDDLGSSLSRDFDRVIEAQKVAFDLFILHKPLSKNVAGQVSASRENRNFGLNANITPRKQRGYMMRQNTKVVVASSDVDRSTRSAGNSPVKKERPQSWTVEPWNGQPRKKSVRESTSPRKKVPSGPVPPMPGHDSNITSLDSLAEEGLATDPTMVEGSERGRLFVKVIGVKDLDLPLPKSERAWFSLTLDNGVHCVTTVWLELGKNAPIGQEFELVVPNDLEFQLTLNAKLNKPEPKRVVQSPTKSSRPSKPSTFSRVFASPKKRKELEMRKKEEEQRYAEQKEREAQAKRMSIQPTAWDLLSPLAAEDGSFGRSYVCLKDHESRCFGRPYVVDVACFNEWATEEATASSSVKSKRGNTHVQRRAPYKVGKLELQLLFVPKPKGAKDEDMPKSMNSCVREMKEAEASLARCWEGHLSQQGGDCPYWRRRFFRLSSNKLTAYHESTGQPRATINLANASKLIDDRRALTQKETTGKGGSRRKSGFAEEEEGYMFVEEGFRIRFANGEVIDFYADSTKDKEGWMKILDQCIGKESVGRGWCNIVFKHEESLRKKAITARHGHGQGRKPSGDRSSRMYSRPKSMIF